MAITGCRHSLHTMPYCLHLLHRVATRMFHSRSAAADLQASHLLHLSKATSGDCHRMRCYRVRYTWDAMGKPTGQDCAPFALSKVHHGSSIQRSDILRKCVSAINDTLPDEQDDRANHLYFRHGLLAWSGMSSRLYLFIAGPRIFP